MRKTLKQTLAILLAVVMIAGTAPFCGLLAPKSKQQFTALMSDFFDAFTTKAEAATYSGSCGDNLIWTLDIDTGELVVSGNGDMRNYNFWDMPEYLEYSYYISKIIIENGVTRIGSYAFFECGSLTSVSIPDSVKVINGWAFANCGRLENVAIPNGTTLISNGAFCGCSLLENVTISASVTEIREQAFSSCDNLAVITVDSANANYCSDDYGVLFDKNKNELIQYPAGNTMTSYTIPDSVTSVNDYAFHGCAYLVNISIPNGIISIGEAPFYRCCALESITVDSANTVYSSDEYGVLFNKDKTRLIQYPAGNTRTSYTIPYGVTNVGYEAFSNCDNLVSVKISDSVTNIANEAFYDCDSLVNITIPDCVTYLGDSAFYSCDNLAKVTLPSGITVINWASFYDCDSLTEVEIPYGVTMVDAEAFYDCNSLEKMIFPTSVREIGASAFESTSLLNIDLPNGVEYIGEKAFYCIETVTTVTIPETVISIQPGAFAYLRALTKINFNAVNANADFDDYNNYYGDFFKECGTRTSGITLVFGEKVETVPMYMFDVGSDMGYPNIKNVVLGSNIKTIGNGAFSYCCSIENVEMNEKLEVIGEGAFEGCIGIESLLLPESVKVISDYAFGGCSSLVDIFIPYNVTTIAEHAFEGTDVKIICFENSNAHKFAIDNNMKYELIRIVLNKTSLELEIGEKFVVMPVSVSDYIDMNAIAWKSSDESIVTVDANGTITAIKGGTAVVSALDSNGAVVANCTVSVKREEVMVDCAIEEPTITNISYGDSIILHANITGDLPAGATIQWSTDNGNFEKVASNDGMTCKITPKSSGDTTITMKVVSADGEVIAEDTQKMTSKAGFFDKLIAFFKKLFGLTKTIPQTFKRIF